ncbi:hypothetical protein PHYPSEUDO_004328 [Phytophthora pseudosyringae]|uniref:Uncharacterized protein n=1 Tax=Phytophthora pseudosyringae TaxID=221518 RepID=A0A8T1VS70_9STRA|nr:hypothetical protein PHYPSEUDO_004328 [Phytophthora pseudosyringae]
MITPPPDRSAPNDEEDEDDDDPGDGVDGVETLSLWSDYLDEVFQDEELDIGYAETGVEPSRVNGAQPQVAEANDEFEPIPGAVLHELTLDNEPNFPQEGRLTGFRAQKVTLEELFECLQQTC